MQEEHDQWFILLFTICDIVEGVVVDVAGGLVHDEAEAEGGAGDGVALYPRRGAARHHEHDQAGLHAVLLDAGAAAVLQLPHCVVLSTNCGASD